MPEPGGPAGEPGDVTRLLRAHGAGDHEAFNQLVPLIYDHLRAVARGQLRRQPVGQSLTATGLVHEAYLKLAGAQLLAVADREHLMAVAALAMRQVLVGRARARLSDKRGGGSVPLPLYEDQVAGCEPQPAWLLDLDRALELLRSRDAALARLFELRFFAGLSERETADALAMPLRSVQRGWMRARAWLRGEMRDAGDARA